MLPPPPHPPIDRYTVCNTIGVSIFFQYIWPRVIHRLTPENVNKRGTGVSIFIGIYRLYTALPTKRKQKGEHRQECTDSVPRTQYSRLTFRICMHILGAKSMD